MPESPHGRASTGVRGLDDVLHGGVPRGMLFLVQGPPGSGKTTLALQFLMEGARRGERTMLVSNGESPFDLAVVADSHGWNLDGIELVRWAEGSERAPGGVGMEYTLFPEAEVEVGETLAQLFDAIERIRPERLAIDSIAVLRSLASTPAFYRRQIKQIRDVLEPRSCTTLMIDDVSAGEPDVGAQSLAHGLLALEHVEIRYGADRRRLRVRKLRSSSYQSGSHDMTLEKGGLRVYPRLVATEHEETLAAKPASSGLHALDEMVGGGLPRGSSTLVMGPAGSGKSTLASLYVHAAAGRGERAAIHLFDESVRTFLLRSAALGLDLQSSIDEGSLDIAHLDPAEFTLGQIADRIIRQVDEDDVELLVIDSLNGYIQSAAEEPMVLLHLRELLSYLARRNVVALITLAQYGVVGPSVVSPVDVGHLADNLFLLRFFETQGQVRRALSMLKCRSGPHERTIRELRMEKGQLGLSEPLDAFSGVLEGTPRYHQTPGPTLVSG